MKKLFFVIPTDVYWLPNKNAKGYTRTTQKGKWCKKYREYEQWKDYVYNCFLQQNTEINIKYKTKIIIDMKLYYNNDKKSDPSNVFKGIEDALADTKNQTRLYKSDNYCIGSFDFFYDKNNPRVEVEITF